MKKTYGFSLAIFLCLIIIFAFSAAAFAAPGDKVILHGGSAEVSINGEPSKIEAIPYIEKGTTMNMIARYGFIINRQATNSSTVMKTRICSFLI